MNHHLTEDDLTLVYFEEAGAVEREHLSGCEECRADYKRLAMFLNAVRAVPLFEPSAGWEERLWSKMAPQVSTTLEQRGRTRWRFFPFRLWVLAPVMAGLLAFAFLAGMYTQHRVAKDAAKSFSPESRRRVLLIALGDHLDRSQIVLAELVNAPQGRSADISQEQQLAGALVSENRLLRQNAAHSGDSADAAVLEQLERVLVEIAHSPAEISASDLADLRRQIEAPGLLFKVRVVSTNAHEKGMKL